MTVTKDEHLTVSTTWQLDHSPEAVWPQLCPVREYDWIEPWQCDLLHSESGYNELGCVFRTAFPTEGGPEIWYTSRFEPFERIEFVRTNDTRVIHYILELEEKDGGTQITWTQHVTALNDNGREYIRNKPELFASQMVPLEQMLDHYLSTGEMLKGKDIRLEK